MLRERNQTIALQAITTMQEGNIFNIDQEIALQAASISHQKKIPMADSLIYAVGQINDAEIWTQDSDFKNLPNVIC